MKQETDLSAGSVQEVATIAVGAAILGAAVCLLGVWEERDDPSSRAFLTWLAGGVSLGLVVCVASAARTLHQRQRDALGDPVGPVPMAAVFGPFMLAVGEPMVAFCLSYLSLRFIVGLPLPVDPSGAALTSLVALSSVVVGWLCSPLPRPPIRWVAARVLAFGALFLVVPVVAVLGVTL